MRPVNEQVLNYWELIEKFQYAPRNFKEIDTHFKVMLIRESTILIIDYENFTF